MLSPNYYTYMFDIAGVLTTSNIEKGGQLPNSVLMSTERQPTNPRLWQRGTWLHIPLHNDHISLVALCIQVLLSLGFGELD